jgi:protein-tyrosine phosphatase
MAREWDWSNDRTRHGGIDQIPLGRTTRSATGRLLLCGKHFIAPEPNRVVTLHDIQRVVCLNEEHELLDRYPQYIRWLRHSPHAHWTPVPDLGAPDLTTLRRIVDEVTHRLVCGETVLVHCGAGIGRAGTLAVAVLVELGSALPDSLDVVAAARPGAGPESGPQRELIEAFAAHRRVERRDPHNGGR